MVVQCEKCGTQYNVDESRIKDGGSKVRCSTCKHIFLIQRPAPPAAPVPDVPEEVPGGDAEFFSTLEQDLGLTDSGGFDRDGQAEEDLDFSSLDEGLGFGEAEQPAEAAGMGSDMDLSALDEDLGGEAAGADEEAAELEEDLDFAGLDDELDFAGLDDDVTGEDAPAADHPERALEADQVFGLGLDDAGGPASAAEPSEDLDFGSLDEGGLDFGSLDESGGAGDVSEDQAEFGDDLFATSEYEDRGGVDLEEILGAAEPEQPSAAGEPFGINGGLAADSDFLDIEDAIAGADVPVSSRAVEAEGPTDGLEDASDLFGREEEEPEFPEPEEYEDLAAEFAAPKKRKRSRARVWILLILLLLAAGGAAVWRFAPELLGPFGSAPQTATVPVEDDKAGNKYISPENAKHFFRQNEKEGQLLVITGLARNHYPTPRSFIQLKGVLHDASGKVLTQKTVYCGNILTEDELMSLPMEDMDKRLSVRGAQGANQSVQPEMSVKFMIVFNEIPIDLAEYTVEALSSEPAQ